MDVKHCAAAGKKFRDGGLIAHPEIEGAQGAVVAGGNVEVKLVGAAKVASEVLDVLPARDGVFHQWGFKDYWDSSPAQRADGGQGFCM